MPSQPPQRNPTGPNDADWPPAGASDAYPSIDLAFQQVGRSYDEVMARFDALHRRLESIQALTLSLTLAVPAIALAGRTAPEFESVWFIAAVVIAVITILIGLASRAWSRIVLVNPRVLYEDWIGREPFAFKMLAVYWAGSHFEENSKLINRISLLGSLMTIGLLAQAGFFLYWFTTL